MNHGSPVRPRLIAITDTAVAPVGRLEGRLAALCAAAVTGSVMIQLRDRELPVRERLELGRRLCAIARQHGQLLAVNDRLDVALLLGADGVHLGESSVEAEDARKLVGPAMMISRACHDPRRAEPRGADAVVLSPVLAARKGNPALGIAVAAEARRAARDALLYALGGVDAEGAARCLAAGFDGVAAIGAVLSRPDPRPLLEALGIVRGG
jgi:thiamine-phosphate pyrophosphorylase